MSNDTVKQELAKTTSTELVPVRGTEIATTAAAAQVRALVEARFTLAIHRPRNMEQVRQDLIKECSRPEFALEDVEGKGNSALYRRPVGGNNFIEGLGIRFAEVAVRCMGNLMDDAITLQDTDTERVKYCYVLDLEKNNSWGDTVHITKTVERKSLKEGEVPLKTRRNSKQELVYLVEASEDALTTKEAALISKKMRTLILRLIPGDLQDRCIEEIRKIREQRILEGPDDAIRSVSDLLYKVNVTVTMVEEFLKHPIGQSSPAEILNLQGLYGSLKDGDTTWAEVMANASEPTTQSEAKSKEPAGNAGMREKVAAQNEGQGQSQKAPQASPTVTSTPPVTAPSTATTSPPSEPAAGARKPPPWMKGTQAPVTQPAPTTQPQQVSEPASEPTLEEKVAQMAKSKAAETAPAVTQQPVQAPAQPAAQRVKPKNPTIKKVPMPEFADRVGPEDAWSDDQYNRAASALSKIGGAHSLEQTIFDWIGIPLTEVNAATLEQCIVVLENWKV